MSDSIPVEIVVSDAELDAAIAKLDALEQQGANVSNAPGVSAASAVGSDEYAGYAEMRAQQRETMFNLNTEGQSGYGSLEVGRGTYAALGLLRGRIPTNFLMRQLLREVGITGPLGILTIFGIDIAIKELVAIDVELKFNAKMRVFEAQRRVQFASIYRGLMTE